MVSALKNIVFIGYGYVAEHVGQLEKRDQRQLYALSRDREKCEQLNQQGITCHIGNLDDQFPHQALSLEKAGVYYFAPPPASGQQDTRLRHFLDSISNYAVKRIVYISTTGVYGNIGHDIITNENSPTQPTTDRALRRLDAEQALLKWNQAYPEREVIILRVVGIYGPNKLPLERIKRGDPLLHPNHPAYVNLIHIDDLAQACYRAMHLGKTREVYNICDSHPMLMTHYFQAIATAFNLPQPPLITMQEAEKKLSAGFLSYLKESRRIDNAKMIHDLGIKLHHPNALDAIKKIVNES